MGEHDAAGLAVCRGISTPCAKLLAAGFSFSCVDDAVDPQPQMTRQQRAAVCEDMPRSGMSSAAKRVYANAEDFSEATGDGDAEKSSQGSSFSGSSSSSDCLSPQSLPLASEWV